MAARDITPPPGYLRAQWGGQSHVATRTLRPLMARAMTFAPPPPERKYALALVSLDACLINDDITRRVERDLARRMPARPVHVVLNCSHTHQGPVMWEPGDVSYALGYADKLVGAVCDAVIEALESAQPATLHLAQRQVTGLNRNRRRKDQAVDRTLSALTARNDGGDPFATAWHFAAHPLTNMGETGIWDSDFPGVTCEQLAPMHAHFLQGPAGDAFPLDWYLGQENPSLPVSDATAIHMGKQLAGHVGAMLDEVAPLDGSQGLSWAETTIDLPVRDVPWTEADAAAAEAHWARQIDITRYQPWLPEDHVTMIAQKYEARYAWTCARFCGRIARLAGTTVPCRLAVARIGPLALALAPGELFTELAFAIQKASPHRHTLVLPYSNGYVSYFPTRRDMEEIAHWKLEDFLEQKHNRWVYGASATTTVGPESGEMIVDALSQLLRKTHAR